MAPAIVTDSTAYLPSAVVAREGIRVVPLHVVIGGAEHTEGLDVSPGEVAAALREFTPVSTSRPSPQVFLETYEEAAAAGADSLVSVHISSAVSGTYEAAQLAARQSPVPVEVVDSRVLGMGLGYAVLSAVQAVGAGASAREAAEVARRRAAAATTVFYVDTLEYLRRGGRIGAASALLGSALAIKPLLTLDDGHIEPLEKVRTTSRALGRMEERAVTAATETGGDAGVDVAVQHLDSRVRAQALADRLRERLPEAHEVALVELGAVVGAHVGPGTIGIVVSPRLEDAPGTVP